jgi:hypothetical protein
MVSGEAGGAAVTSIGASLFWATAGVGTNAIAAAKPPKALNVTRRTAVILPALLDEPRSPV